MPIYGSQCTGQRLIDVSESRLAPLTALGEGFTA